MTVNPSVVSLVSPSGTPKLSACLIVRNEAARLPRCLTSLSGVADELIVVDTGSTDDTVAIASGFKAKIVREAWQEDFSKARNAALAAATGHWVISIDADEWLSKASRSALKQALAKPDVRAYKLTLVNHLDGGRQDRELLTRLFRRDPRVHWRGRIHEQVTESLAEILEHPSEWREAPNVVLEHDGYLRTILNEKKKGERNRRLLDLAVEEAPGDPYLRYKLSRELSGADALAHLEAALATLLSWSVEKLRVQPWAEQALINGALALSCAERPAVVEQITATSRAAFGDHPALYLACARAQLRLGRPGEALATASVGTSEVTSGPDFDRAQLRSELELCAAQAERTLGDFDAAHRRLTQLRKTHPEFGAATHGLIELAIAAKDYKNALRLALTRLREHPSDATALSLSAVVAERVGDLEAAARWRRSSTVTP